MAFKTGTAADHIALWNTLLDFLQNDSELVSAGQEWQIAWQNLPSNEVILKGPGLSGSDEVFVGLKRTDETLALTESLIWLTGCTGIIESATGFTGHVNSLARTPGMFIDHNPMQYWMVANGRRFVVVVKISTVYQAMYGGLFMPYSLPAAYPYPMFVGGTRGFSGYSVTYRPETWRTSERDSYRHFVYPRSNTGASTWFDSQALMLAPDAQWRAGTLDYNGNTYNLPRFVLGPRGFPNYMGFDPVGDISGPTYSESSGALGYDLMRSRLIAGLNGEMPLTPITLMAFENSSTPSPVTYGILDGVYSVPGVGNVAENIVTVDGLDHLVVPNVMRTSEYEYWALALG